VIFAKQSKLKGKIPFEPVKIPITSQQSKSRYNEIKKSARRIKL